MTGYPEFNFPAFHEAKSRLKKLGFKVCSPADFGPEGTWEDCLKRDLRYVVKCDAVVTLPGWRQSRGAKLEVHVAKALGMPVVPMNRVLNLLEN